MVPLESHPVFRLLRCLLGLGPKPRHLSHYANGMIRTTRREGGFERAWSLRRAGRDHGLTRSFVRNEANSWKDGTPGATAGIGFVCATSMPEGGANAKTTPYGITTNPADAGNHGRDACAKKMPAAGVAHHFTLPIRRRSRETNPIRGSRDATPCAAGGIGFVCAADGPGMCLTRRSIRG